MRQLPFITITLCALSTGLMFHPAVDHALLYYDSALLATGNFWGLLTGHLIHVDTSHWFWNTLALAVLGTFLETRSHKLMALSLLAGVAAVDVLLLSPLAEISQYCGLSGVLNTLLGVALYCYWLDTRSRWVVLATVLCLGKVLLELVMDTALLTHIAWPPYPPAHLAGVVGACVLLFFYNYFSSTIFFNYEKDSER
jgi:rhomboid family GlyGly-CTERM serine protease